MVADTIINITFAFFMLHKVYCKINEYRAKFSLLDEFLITPSIQNRTDAFEIQRIFGDAHPIVSEHLQCLQKARKKLPALSSAGFLFAKIPYEQATAENVAAFHAKMAGPANILSITGGLGSDDIAFARNHAQVTSLDPDACLNALLQYNLQTLNITGIHRATTTAELFLQENTETFDLVFADPDRRPEGKKTHGNAALYSPDVFALWEKYPQVASRWLLKLSPVTDIAWLRQRINAPFDIHVVAADGEVKEVLCDIRPDSGHEIWQHEIGDGGVFTWDGTAIELAYSEITVFVEAAPATIKSGFHRSLAGHFGLENANDNATYFTGNKLIPAPIGRSFQLQDRLRGSLSSIQKELTLKGIVQANISSRDFVMGTEELKKKTGIKDGGDTYLFFTGKQEKTCFVCRKF
jgi:hypothetical protein